MTINFCKFFFNIFMSFLSQLNKSCVEIWQYLWQCLWSIMVWPKFHLSDNTAMLIKSHVSYFLFWIDTRISWNEHDSILFVSYEILHSKLIARIIIKCSLCSCQWQVVTSLSFLLANKENYPLLINANNICN